MAVKKNNMTFDPCQIGLGSSKGYIVKYKGSLIAILEQDESSGKVNLANGFEHPFICTFCSWNSIEDARAEFLSVCKLYDTGETPREIERALEQLEKSGAATLGRIELIQQG